MVASLKKLIPREYRNRVVKPVTLEHHAEPSANADKVFGYDARGNRCFYYHSFLLRDEGFDIDEFPIQIDVYYECVVAWRLRRGNWIRIKSYADRLDGCNKHLTTLPIEVRETF